MPFPSVFSMSTLPPRWRLAAGHSTRCLGPPEARGEAPKRRNKARRRAAWTRLPTPDLTGARTLVKCTVLVRWLGFPDARAPRGPPELGQSSRAVLVKDRPLALASELADAH